MYNKATLLGIRYADAEGWNVYSPFLSSPVRCGTAAEAKRFARAVEIRFPQFRSIDYSEIDAAIARDRALALFRK